MNRIFTLSFTSALKAITDNPGLKMQRRPWPDDNFLCVNAETTSKKLEMVSHLGRKNALSTLSENDLFASDWTVFE